MANDAQPRVLNRYRELWCRSDLWLMVIGLFLDYLTE